MMRNFFIVVAAIIFLDVQTCAAENLKFIDAKGDVGYFVDVDTFKSVSPSVFEINFVVIKIDVNQMEVTALQINHAEKTYTILSTKTLSYDERAELATDDEQRPARSYSDKSLMGEMVHIILYGGD